MAQKSEGITYSRGFESRTVIAPGGAVLKVPDGWDLLLPGDPGLTRRVKLAGDHYAVAERKGRKVFSRGVWADAATIERIRAELEVERSTAGYAKKQASAARRRDAVQASYVEDFKQAILNFLRFDAVHAAAADKMAMAVAKHATPVGSGTVARTERIPIEDRAEAAVIAWMRHQTTGYDNMLIVRLKGERREVRRKLARKSHELLDRYRAGKPPLKHCRLKEALDPINEESDDTGASEVETI